MKKVTTVGFDADDTLWHHEQFFKLTEKRFADLLADYTEREHLAERLLDAEQRNIGHYGFGVKAFTLSMIETALDVTDDRVPGSIIRELIDAGREMLSHPIELLPHAREAVVSVAETHRIVLITKGDLLDQERKLAQSGLGDFFHGVEIVSDKTPQTYREIFHRHGEGPEAALMVGNSVKSDVLPVLTLGGWGVFVPQELAWGYEFADPPHDHDRFRQLPNLSELEALLQQI